MNEPNALDALELLARDDKWFLGGGRGLIFAPPFPLHLDRPGFWDAAHYLHFAFEPIYTYALVDEHLREVPLRSEGRRWRPDRLVQRFGAPGLEITETKLCAIHDALVTQVTVRNLGEQRRALQVVAWSAQPLGDRSTASGGEAGTATAGIQGSGVEGFARDGHLLALTRSVGAARGQVLPLTLALGMSGAASHSVNLAEPTANHPRFAFTPFYEKLTDGGLPNEERLAGLVPGGLLYLGLQRPLVVEPGRSATFRVVAALAPEAGAALTNLRAALHDADPAAAVEAEWRSYFAGLPRFRCDDPFLEKYYYYRWYGLRLNTIDVQQGNYRHPAVCEGIGYFRAVISYSAQAHLRETRWMHQPRLPHGIIRTYLERQTEHGTFPAHLYRDWSSPQEIYHADWGAALLAALAIHPDPALLAGAYRALARYAEHFLSQRNADGLFEIVNQWETGQEYMSRYMAVDSEADHWRPMNARLTGVDASVYMLRVFDALATLAERLDQPGAKRWRDHAARTRQALLERCWNPETEAFHDLTPTGERVPTLHGTSFYPYFTDLVGPEHLGGLRRHLLNPQAFWTDFPVPSSALSDPYFSATPEWKGKRHNCPWNGRTWPMTNSHVAEALLHSAQLDERLRTVAAEFIGRFVRMMFEDGALERPNCYEHYHPFTGRAALYRGIDDYMHSWVVDLLIRAVAGVQPDGERVRIDPLPFGVPFSLENVRVRGRWLDVRFHPDDGLRVAVDGREVARRPGLEPVELEF